MLQRRMVRLAWLSGFLFAAATSTVARALPTFTVNSISDVVDANPGDGKCETAPGNGVCALRTATDRLFTTSRRRNGWGCTRSGSILPGKDYLAGTTVQPHHIVHSLAELI